MLGFLALVVVAILGAARAARDELERFAAGLEEGLVHGGRAGPWRVEGRLRGRRLRLEQQAPLQLLSAEVAHAPVELVVGSSRGVESLARRLGLVPPAPQLPAPGLQVNLVARQGAAEAEALFQHQAARRALLDLFEKDGAAEVALRAGRLQVTWSATHPTQQELERVAKRLCALAELCERREAARTVDAPLHVEAFAWTGGGAAARCPYCRDELARAGEEPAGCPSCRTLHHRACLEEAGGCTVFGCRGGPEPRARSPLGA